MCGIKDKAGYIIQFKISDIANIPIWKTGPATIGRPSIKTSSSIWIYSVRFLYIISFISFDLCNSVLNVFCQNYIKWWLVDLQQKSQQTIQDLIAEENFWIIPKDVLSSLLTENSKYFDMVVELQQKTLDTFSNFTQKTTETNKNILDKSNIIIETISDMNRNTNINIPRNDNNLGTFPRTKEEFDVNVRVELQKRRRLH